MGRENGGEACAFHRAAELREGDRAVGGIGPHHAGRQLRHLLLGVGAGREAYIGGNAFGPIAERLIA